MEGQQEGCQDTTEKEIGKWFAEIYGIVSNAFVRGKEYERRFWGLTPREINPEIEDSTLSMGARALCLAEGETIVPRS